MRKEYVCFKKGERKNSKATIRRRGLTREKCGAKLAVVRKARDLYNDKRDRKNVVHGHDANILYEHFEMEQQKNLGFRFTFERDDKDRMTHCFWADATSRKSYQYFGDVVVFDTTYYTNKYFLIFAPILGVNHHRQTTLLGCAFLSDEKTDSFMWLFNEWLKAMPGGPPKMIITDQDPAMTRAITSALPNTFHRYCIWHIDMYEIRDRWVPAYTNHMFSVHMTSSQRAEISHSFFKRYVSKKNSMMDFVTRFNRALAKIRHNELNLDHKDVNEKPLLKTSWAMEKKMSEIYTRSIFERFQEEIFQINAYMVTFIRENEHWCLWNVQREETEGARTCEISVDKSSNLVSYSCKLFEFDGIPCRHLLAYLFRMQIRELPSEYILHRWTKTAKAGRVMDDLGSGVKEICNSSFLVRRQGLFQLACTVIDDAVLDEEESEVVRDALKSSQMKIALMRSSRQDGSTNCIQVPPSLGSQHSLKEPL
ncbi:protein FAR1-RELATED SEQUENCE 5-like [Rhododendron vialii]|uniref:protein FAR1-RELATED SEQUENCE 5-like n=1 Tax=Rhododendron vialii TaxID=182163 RepID=UPI00265F5AEC|nr:protein FAR1-RELATED SEQUENCE 5-like [Rhododendron vialii]